MSKKRLLTAQVKVLRWLQGRISDQFVKAYIQTEIESLERIGYPIDTNGTELVFPKQEKKPKVNQDQLDIEEELRVKNNRVIIICNARQHIRSVLGLNPNNPQLVIVTPESTEKLYGHKDFYYYELRPMYARENTYVEQHDGKSINKTELFELLGMFAS